MFCQGRTMQSLMIRRFLFRRNSSLSRAFTAGAVLGIFAVGASVFPLAAREKSKIDYGLGLAVEVDSPEADVLQAVQDVVEDGIIEGSKEYNKDENVGGASAVASTAVFPGWTGPGKVFYKVRTEALDPRNFKDSNDVGTLGVRYVVEARGPKKTLLRIDAVFVEDFKHTVHASNGSVESAEYKEITDHIDQLNLSRKESEETAKKHEQDVAKQVLHAAPASENSASRLAAAQAYSQTLEQHVQQLRHQVERRVAATGAPLKSAPFHTASTLKSLDPGTEVVILIVTPYWYGIETQEGQHGWVFHSQLETLP